LSGKGILDLRIRKFPAGNVDGEEREIVLFMRWDNVDLPVNVGKGPVLTCTEECELDGIFGSFAGGLPDEQGKGVI